MTDLVDESVQLDEEGDLIFEDGDIAIVEGTDEMVQSLTLILKSRLGEDRISPTIGIPIQAIIQVSEEEYISGAIVRALRADDRVLSIKDVRVEIDRVNRVAEVDVTVTLVSGANVELNTDIGV